MELLICFRVGNTAKTWVSSCSNNQGLPVIWYLLQLHRYWNSQNWQHTSGLIKQFIVNELLTWITTFNFHLGTHPTFLTCHKLHSRLVKNHLVITRTSRSTGPFITSRSSIKTGALNGSYSQTVKQYYGRRRMCPLLRTNEEQKVKNRVREWVCLLPGDLPP